MKKDMSGILAIIFFFCAIGIFAFEYTHPAPLPSVVEAAQTSVKQIMPNNTANVSNSSNGTVLPNEVELKDVVNKKVIKQLKLNDSNTVVLIGEVNEKSFGIAQQITQRSNSNSPTYLLISSPGGSVLDGVEIVSAIQASHAPVYTVCVEICASMASIIFEAGKQRYMVDRSILMFHEASGGVQGSFNQIKSRFRIFERLVNKLDYEVAQRVGMSYETFKAQLSNEIWLDSEDAVNQHYADGFVNVHLQASESASDEVKSQTKAMINKIVIQEGGTN